MRLCEPCSYLEKLTCSDVMAALAGKGGLRADIITGGVIRVGDVIADVLAEWCLEPQGCFNVTIKQ